MEKEGKSLICKDEEMKRPSSLKTNKIPNKKVTQKGLNMTRLGKPDLLRLLSILEGELEARDIYIVNLQAQLNQGPYKEGRYFNHQINDPFIALMRDNEAMNGSVTPTEDKARLNATNNNMVKIQPLPLLEKLSEQFKKQQGKVKQHLALSDAYYHMVNEELSLEKKRNVDSNSDSSSLELEQLRISTRVEQNRSKKLEAEYKKLLQLVNRERQKYRSIITLLLEERRMREAGEKGNKENDLIVEDLVNQDQKTRTSELESSLEELRSRESRMQREVEALRREVLFLNSKLPLLGDADPAVTSQRDGCRDETVVTVRRTPTVVEKRKIPPKLPAKTVARSNSLSGSGRDPKKGNSRPPRMTLPSSPATGLESPGEPPLTPFPPNNLRPHSAPNPAPFLATRQKFQRVGGNLTLDKKNSRPDKIPALDGVFPMVTSEPFDTKPPQPTKPVKQNSLSSDCNHNESMVKPPPLPPKKPHLAPKHNSMKSVPSSKKDVVKKNGINNENCGLIAPKAPPPKINISRNLSTKRTSLNSNNNNNRMFKNHDTQIQPSPPNGQTPPRLQLSAQQRLFTQDGSSGELRSPVTHNVPKSPLAPNIFTFK